MYKAIKTFAGIKIAMKKGDKRNFIEKEIAEDLLRAGYIEELPDTLSIKAECIKLYPDGQVVEEVKEVEKPKKTTSRKKK